jgi:hypothetical protein
MARDIPIQANVDPDLYTKLKADADRNLRSMSAEIYLRLKSSYSSEKPLASSTTTEG